MGYHLGVDLGTTFTSAAVAFEGRVEVVRLGSRSDEMPSVVFLAADGTVLIGDAADRRGAADPSRLAREFKRRLGDPVAISVGGAPLSASALTGRLLRHVVDVVLQQQGGPFDTITVAHPANWGPYKLEVLNQAIRSAGLDAATLCTEPEAIAIANAAEDRIAVGEIVAVYDLGGGTFDAAVLRRSAAGFDVIGRPEGIEHLGGVDFDAAVFQHVLEAVPFRLEPASVVDDQAKTALSRLRRDCVEAKEALSYDAQAVVTVALPSAHTSVQLHRSEFEQMIRPALQETLQAMHRALRSADVAPEQVRTVLLAGGSARIPLVAELLRDEFQRPIALDPHPEHSAALGAAMVGQAAAQRERSASSGSLIAAPTADEPGAVAAQTGETTGRSARNRALGIAGVVAAVTVAAVVVARPWGSDLETTGPSATTVSGAVPDSPIASSSISAVEAGCTFRDEFDAAEVDSSWRRLPGNGTFRIDNGSLRMTAPDGADIYEQAQGAPMMLREVEGDFVLETELTASPDQFYQGVGLVIWDGVDSYVRLERGFGDVGAILFEYRDHGAHVKVHSGGASDPRLVRTDAERVALQLGRNAGTVQARWRPADEAEWQQISSIPIDLPASIEVGVAILNRDQGDGNPADFSANFHYFSSECVGTE